MSNLDSFMWLESCCVFLEAGECILWAKRHGAEDESDDPSAEHHLPSDAIGKSLGWWVNRSKTPPLGLHEQILFKLIIKLTCYTEQGSPGNCPVRCPGVRFKNKTRLLCRPTLWWPLMKMKIQGYSSLVTFLAKTPLYSTCLSGTPGFVPPVANFDGDATDGAIIAPPAPANKTKKGNGTPQKTPVWSLWGQKILMRCLFREWCDEEEESSRQEFLRRQLSAGRNNRGRWNSAGKTWAFSEICTIFFSTWPKQMTLVLVLKELPEKEKEKEKEVAHGVSLVSYRQFFRELDVEVLNVLQCGLLSCSLLDSELHTNVREEWKFFFINTWKKLIF